MATDDSQFEQPLVEIRSKIEELEGYPSAAKRDRELDKLRTDLDKKTGEIFSSLSPWQMTLLARHAERPYTLDFIERIFDDFVELHGDRAFGDDPAIVAGFARHKGRAVAVVGHQKGRGTQERIRRNFGQPRPEGYRKALRVMRIAERFGRPVITFVDTPGAYPGRSGEERGQAEAIARNLIEMADLSVPILTVVTGEGGSGGALALGVANRVLILEYGVYSVITPEGCAAILWKDQDQRAEAARAMKGTAPDLLRFGIVDEILPEPPGGAHTDPDKAARTVDEAITRHLAELDGLDASALRAGRYDRFRQLGEFG